VYALFFPNGLYMISPDVQDDRYMWHLWTLSVEEFFYFLIPGTVLVCIRRNWVKQLGWLLGIGFVAIGVARFFAITGFWQYDDGMIAGVRLALLQRPDALMLGCFAAIVNASITPERWERLRKPVTIAASVALVVWLLMLNTSSGLVERLGGPYFPYLPDGPEQFNHEQMMGTLYWFRFGHTIGALAFMVILFGLVHCRSWWLSRLWSWSPFQWMGRLSYTLYVWHALPYLLLMGALGGEDAPLGQQLVRLPILVASAFIVSMPVYYLVEMRVLRMKLRFSAEKEALDLTTGKMVDVEQLTSRPIGSAAADVAPDAATPGTPKPDASAQPDGGRPAT
jgi:peptidoglycan/LPS O-acetylase OafA/YrhL